MSTKLELGSIYKIAKDRDNKLGTFFLNKEVKYIGEYSLSDKYCTIETYEDVIITVDSKKIKVPVGTQFIVLKDNLVFSRYEKVIYPKDFKIRIVNKSDNKNTMLFTLLRDTKKLEDLDRQQQKLKLKGSKDKESTLSTKIRENRAKISNILNAEIFVQASRIVNGVKKEISIPMPTISVNEAGKDIIKKDLKNAKLKAFVALNSLIREERASKKLVEKVIKNKFGSVTLLGKVHSKPEEYLKLYNHIQSNYINDEKVPFNSENFIGIEIELISKSDVTELKNILIKHKLQKWTNVTSDGSLRTSDGYNYTHEIRVLLPESKREDILKQLGVALQDAKCSVNSSCGLHVHLDMRNRDVATAFHNLVKMQKFLIDSQPIERRSNTYCKPTEFADIEKYSYKDGHRGRSERYLVINPMSYARHKTLEIRVHKGTVDCIEISNWINFLLPIVNKSTKLESAPRKVETIPNYIENIPQTSLDYINNNINAFA
jgi:hypothetical protein